MISCTDRDVSETEINTETETDTEVRSDTISTSQSNRVQAGKENPVATAMLYSKTEDADDVTGYVVFTQTNQGVRVEATITGMEMQTDHGFHIHQYGDCRAIDASSAGGHFNPTNEEHGAPSDENRHMGDLGNISTNEQGTAEVDFIDEKLVIDGPNSITGRAVIVHANEDDLVSQPSGAAGPRVACGVIGIANPEVTIDQYDGMRSELQSE